MQAALLSQRQVYDSTVTLLGEKKERWSGEASCHTFCRACFMLPSCYHQPMPVMSGSDTASLSLSCAMSCR